MPRRPKKNRVDSRRVELDGIRYVIVRESVFEKLCEKAGVSSRPDTEPDAVEEIDMDPTTLAEKLARRRKGAGLSQAQLARLAGIRPETVNRIERGRTTPDFSTVRKLVVAIDAAEREQAEL